MERKKIYLVGIGGIGVSGLARYYLSENWEVCGSDSTDSQLISRLRDEGCNIIIGSDSKKITKDIDFIIYSEAVPDSQEELQKARELGIKTLKYNEALAEVVNTHKLIAVTGTHGKSTTSSMISQILLNSQEDFAAIVGTLLKEFDGKNFYSSIQLRHSEQSEESIHSKLDSSVVPHSQGQNYFVIEACEHKEHFLAYKPTVGVITNIEYDHADYFKTPKDYLHAFEKFVENIVPGGFCVINGEDKNCKKLIGKRKDIHYILVKNDTFSTIFPELSLNSLPKGEMKLQESNIEEYPEIVMHIPGEHIIFDAKIAYIVSYMIGIPEITSLEALENYCGVWRRMEHIGLTENKNILMSDYGHHPTEIQTTLRALKNSPLPVGEGLGVRDKKLFVIFQPHQYSRTIELLDGFKTCFGDADSLIIPNIYESRDTQENKDKMNTQILVDAIDHSNVENGQGMENTLKLIEQYDSKNPDSSIILLLGAGNVDNLRYKIKTNS